MNPGTWDLESELWEGKWETWLSTQGNPFKHPNIIKILFKKYLFSHLHYEIDNVDGKLNPRMFYFFILLSKFYFENIYFDIYMMKWTIWTEN